MTPGSDQKMIPALLHVLNKGLAAVTSFCLFLSGILLGLMVFFYAYEVVVRYFFDSPTSWTFDLGKAILCSSVILALPDITRNQGNITIDVFLEKLSKKTRYQANQIISLFCFVVCLLTAYICLDETIRQYQNDIGTFWINPVPKWWISVFIPFGFALSGLHFLKLGFQRWDSKQI